MAGAKCHTEHCDLRQLIGCFGAMLCAFSIRMRPYGERGCSLSLMLEAEVFAIRLAPQGGLAVRATMAANRHIVCRKRIALSTLQNLRNARRGSQTSIEATVVLLWAKLWPQKRDTRPAPPVLHRCSAGACHHIVHTAIIYLIK